MMDRRPPFFPSTAHASTRKTEARVTTTPASVASAVYRPIAQTGIVQQQSRNRPTPPPVYRPQVMSVAAPPAVRPTPPPSPVMQQRPSSNMGSTAVYRPSTGRVVAPPVYRPQMRPAMLQRKVPEVPAAPPVYRPPAVNPPVPTVFRPGTALNPLQRMASSKTIAPPVHRPVLGASPNLPPHFHSVTIQRVKFVAGDNWYDTDDIIKDPESISRKRSVPVALEGIANGIAISNMIGVKNNPIKKVRTRIPFPSEIQDAKAALKAIEESAQGAKKRRAELKRKRDELELERIEDLADKTSQSDYERGRALAVFGKRRMVKVFKKLGEKKEIKEAIGDFNALPAAQYDKHSASMMNGFVPLEAMYAVTESSTKRFDHNIHNTKVMIDGYDGDREKERDPVKVVKGVHKPTMKVVIGSKSSYRYISERPQPPVAHPGHPLLTSLEVLRNPESAATNFLKQGIYEVGGMTHQERYSAESEFTFMEPQGATSETRPIKMRKVQHASASRVLHRGNSRVRDKELGKQVKAYKRSTPGKIHDSFEKAYKPQGSKDQRFEFKQGFSREFLRLVRSQTGMEIDSEEESLSETELNEDYK